LNIAPLTTRFPAVAGAAPMLLGSPPLASRLAITVPPLITVLPVYALAVLASVSTLLPVLVSERGVPGTSVIAPVSVKRLVALFDSAATVTSPFRRMLLPMIVLLLLLDVPIRTAPLKTSGRVTVEGEAVLEKNCAVVPSL